MECGSAVERRPERLDFVPVDIFNYCQSNPTTD